MDKSVAKHDIHSYNYKVAVEVGVIAAVLFQNLSYWVEFNKANNKSYHNGRYWTYNSYKAYAELFPEFSQRQIAKALKDLEEKGYIMSGCYNQNGYDRTKWYTLGTAFDVDDENIALNSNIPKCKMEYAESVSSNIQKGEIESTESVSSKVPKEAFHITNINTDINSNINTSEDVPLEPPRKKKSVKKAYGEFSNVKITDEELAKLNEAYTEQVVSDYIRKVDEYVEQTGKKYKSHYLTIRNWISKDVERGYLTIPTQSQSNQPEEDYSKYFA